MRFTLPVTPPQDLIQGIGNIRSIWLYRWATYAVIGQLAIGGAFVAWAWSSLPPQIPMWYSRPWGDERLATPWFLFLPLISAIIVYIMNLTVIVRVATDHPMFARVLLLTSLLVSLLSGIMVIRIVTLIS